MNSEPVIGIIGGSGLYEMDGLEAIERVTVRTPFGDPSDAFITGVLTGRRLVFLPRHGVGHRILPHEINYRANVWGMKSLGVTQLISVSAVGSMKESIVPGHLVFADQFIDLTRRRISTFFGDGLVGHVPFAEPICGELRTLLAAEAVKLGIAAHDRGTYVCIDGPQFSTRAESLVYRSWGVDIIGMTNMPEAKLAREAELCYATIALATDYDCWHETEASVTVEAIMATLHANVDRAKAVLRAYVERAPNLDSSPCRSAARTSLMTAPERIPQEVREALDPILGSFLPKVVQ